LNNLEYLQTGLVNKCVKAGLFTYKLVCLYSDFQVHVSAQLFGVQLFFCENK